MKILVALLITVLSFSVCEAQVKKGQIKDQPKTAQLPPDSIVQKTDTLKMRFVVYVEDGTLGWVYGYLVLKSAYATGTQQSMVLSQKIYTSKWEALKPEDVYEMKQNPWK